MTLTGCFLCHESHEPGWLCEEHAGKPWGHDGCEAAGAPCTCNPTGAVLWREVFAAPPPPR